MNLTVRTPKPHGKQVDILNSHAKRKVINAGRRGGKTTLAAMVSCRKFREGRRVLLSSTTQEQADAFWEKINTWLRPLIDAKVIERNIQRRILTMPTGGRIKVKTASDADTLRGDYADFLVLDECAYLDEDAWKKVGAPMLLDNDGDAWFISTPNRRNWFHKLYHQAVADGTRWQAFHFTSYDNPHLSQSALAELTNDMTEEDIKQEILAQFLEGTGAVFRNITACTNAPVGTTPADHQGHEFVMGVDWARHHDATVISVVCTTCRAEVFLDRFTQVAWSLQRSRLRTAYDLWQPYTILAESNSIGGPNIEALLEEDIPVTPFETTGVSKPPLIRRMARALERVEYQWLPDPVATGEFEAYEQKPSAGGNSTQYSAPSGLHDDCVISRSLALTAASQWGSLT